MGCYYWSFIGGGLFHLQVDAGNETKDRVTGEAQLLPAL
jgi:hypothetical protein